MADDRRRRTGDTPMTPVPRKDGVRASIPLWRNSWATSAKLEPRRLVAVDAPGSEPKRVHHQGRRCRYGAEDLAAVH